MKYYDYSENDVVELPTRGRTKMIYETKHGLLHPDYVGDNIFFMKSKNQYKRYVEMNPIEIRKQLKIQERKLMVLYCCDLYPLVDVPFLDEIKRVINKYNLDMQMIIKLHPATDYSAKYYQKILGFSTYKNFDFLTMLRACNIVISTGICTTHIQACYFEKPMIVNRMSNTISASSCKWPLTGDEPYCIIEKMEDFEPVMRHIMKESTRKELIEECRRWKIGGGVPG